MPYFFQWDDIEFGLRCADMGVTTVTLPGAAVWHAPFTHKDWDDWSRYFSFRNSLITAALHSEMTPVGAARAIGLYYAKHMVAMQYGLVATLVTAVEDFLAGPDCLSDGGPAAMARVRHVRSDYPDTKIEEPTAIRQVELLSAEKQERLRKKPLIPPFEAANLVLRQFFAPMPEHPQVGTAAADDAYWWFLGRLDAAVVTDASREGFRIRRRDPELARSLARSGMALIRRLIAEYDSVREAYQAEAAQLRSRENWTRLFTS
jgi:galactofuranosylgalactofuranosylrhamnosyl-N-acetylglucosaminyl-diphospho-decaprenol beta-1,5/1,6-galactofuranosyltransferase